MYVNILCSWVKLMSYELLWLNCVRIHGWLLLLLMFEKHVDELVCWVCHWWINDESCCCCWIIFGSLVKFWIETKIRLDSWFLSILVFMFVYMTYKLHLGWVLSVGGSKLENLGKRVLKFEVFFELLSVRSSKLWGNLKRACPGASGHSSLERAACKALSELKCFFWTELAWASCKRAPSEHAQKLLRLGRLSEPAFA